ncbi:hypothetical protein ZWY2020_000883 [Hordeum vulgare]|nr:hypothetical protein ZWY2020_000883 [Hordeum vulgare]
MGKNQAYKAMQRALAHPWRQESINQQRFLLELNPGVQSQATKRFEAAYPIIKELALVGTPGYKAVKQASQHRLYCEGNARK